jgi:hypothetical protein
MGHRPERRRRLHPVGHRDPHPRRDRERTAASACGHNAGKDELDLILPQRFYTCEQSKAGDRHVYACGSRFIPGAVGDRFECRGTGSGGKPANQQEAGLDH